MRLLKELEFSILNTEAQECNVKCSSKSKCPQRGLEPTGMEPTLTAIYLSIPHDHTEGYKWTVMLRPHQIHMWNPILKMMVLGGGIWGR